MIFFSAILVLASAVTGAAVNAPFESMSLRRSLPDGYVLSNVTWKIPIAPNGENQTFNGTVQEVFAQLNNARIRLGLSPLDDPLGISNSTGTTALFSTELLLRRNHLQKRSYDHTICGVGLQNGADVQRIFEGSTYLTNLKGSCGMNGPRVCGRISCSWNSAIYWCNDNEGYTEYDCSSFAPYAQIANGLCMFTYHNDLLTLGQAFTTENFNVIVGSDSC
ncbi:hypothetical protein F5Y16DRAFT_423310 [Xylariaceae sp. FL0255]|nr:hypothetical protein F5Y16DRAFT_423310 [Xylariaceae sp. FL0255]